MPEIYTSVTGGVFCSIQVDAAVNKQDAWCWGVGVLIAVPRVRVAPLLLYSEGVVLDSQLCNSTTCSFTRPVSVPTRYISLIRRPELPQERHVPLRG